MTDLLTYLLRSAACLSLFYGFYWLFLRKETFFAINRVFLVSAALLSVLLPFIRITSPFFETVISGNPFLAGPPADLVSGPTPVDPFRIITLIYLSGVLVFALRLLVRLASLILAIRRSRGERRDGLRVVFSGHGGEPFSFFNCIFLDAAGIGERDLDKILAHESAHVRQGHSLDILLTELLAIFQWFNPFVWPYKRSLRETHEYLADRAAIAQGCSLAGYELLIVEQHVGGQLFDLASNFRNSQIKRRLWMLSKTETKGLARMKPLWMVPLAVALLMAFAESRLVIQSGQETAAAGDKRQVSDAAGTKSDEEVIKALKAKFEQLDKLTKENQLKIKALKAEHEKASDPAEKEKLMNLLKEQKFLSLELGMKSRTLSMKKLDIAISREADPARKEELEQQLEQLETETKEYAQKLQQIKGTDEKVMLGLSENLEKLDQIRKENDLKMKTVEAKYNEASDPAEKEKLMNLLKEQKLLSLELGMKSRTLSMKKLEGAIEKETDPARKMELKQKLEQLETETKQYAEKLQQVKEAEKK